MLISSSRNIVFHRKSDVKPTRKRVGFTPKFITPNLCHNSKVQVLVLWKNGTRTLNNLIMETLPSSTRQSTPQTGI